MNTNRQGDSHHHEDLASQIAATPFRNKSSGRLAAARPAEDAGYQPPATDEGMGYEDQKIQIRFLSSKLQIKIGFEKGS